MQTLSGLILYIYYLVAPPHTDTLTPSRLKTQETLSCNIFLTKLRNTKEIQNVDLEVKKLQVLILVLMFLNMKCWEIS